MSPTSHSPIRAEGSTPSRETTKIQKPTRPSSSSSGSHRSSTRHAAVVEKIEIAVSVLLRDREEVRSLLGVFPGVLELAVSRFLGDVARRAHRRGGTSSIRQGHFMDSRDRGRSNRAEREKASQATVKARKEERDRAFLDRGG